MAIAVSTIGGVVGLISGLFVLFDRFYKGRPVASLTIRETGTTRKLVCVRIKNTTPYDVAVLGAHNRQGTYFLTEDEEVSKLIEGAAGTAKFAFLLKPDETKELIIKAMYKAGLAIEVTRPGYVEFVISWRPGNATWLTAGNPSQVPSSALAHWAAGHGPECVLVSLRLKRNAIAIGQDNRAWLPHKDC